MTDTATDKDAVPALLAALETEFWPTKRRQNARWRPENIPACTRSVRTPQFSWTRPDADFTQPFVNLDINGAWFAPLSMVNLAFNGLQHTGPDVNGSAPGYYQVRAHVWQGGHCMPSPLGTAPLPPATHRSVGPRVWIAQPTLELLQQLAASGHWPDAEILDSWTCPPDAGGSVGIYKWAMHCRQQRRDALLSFGPGSAEYKAVKDSLAIAVQMWAKEGAKCKVHRPDWTHTVKALHAANAWRKGWDCAFAGHVVLRMASVDELTIRQQDFIHMQAVDNPPIKFDPTGVQLGAYKIKMGD